MALRTPPSWLQNGSHPAENDRLTTQGLWRTTGILSAADLAVTQSGTPAMSVSVAAGWANILGTFQASMGAYQVYNDAATTLTVTTADVTNPRIDLVVVAVQDAFYSGVPNTVVFTVVAGTPAASPAVPTAPVNSISLAQLAVAANATTVVTANITDLRVLATTGTAIASGAAAAGTLTGATLAAGVTASSLTSFGASPAMTDLKQTRTVNVQSGATYTFVLTDVDKVVQASNAGTKTFSIPTDASVAFGSSQSITVQNTGAGLLTINAVTPGTTTVTSLGTVSASPTVAVNGVVTLRKTAANVWVVNGDVVAAAASGGGSPALNALINGDFLINQRVFTSNTATGAYGFDRWLQQNVGGTCTVTPQTFTPGAAPIAGVEGRTFVQLVTATQAAVGDYGILTQRIEDVTRFAGQTIAVSFYAKAAAGTPSVGVEVQQNFGAGGTPSATVSTPISAVVLSTSWVRYTVSVAVPSISGKTLGTTANTSYLELNLWISSGSTNATRASSIGIQNGTFSFWGAKVEAGSSATAFQTATGNRASELAACQRYYWQIGGDNTVQNIGQGVSEGTTTADIVIVYPVTMRIASTTTAFSTLALGDQSNAPVVVTGCSTSQAGPNRANFVVATGGGLTQYRPYYLQANASLAAYFSISAEL